MQTHHRPGNCTTQRQSQIQHTQHNNTQPVAATASPPLSCVQRRHASTPPPPPPSPYFLTRQQQQHQHHAYCVCVFVCALCLNIGRASSNTQNVSSSSSVYRLDAHPHHHLPPHRHDCGSLWLILSSLSYFNNTKWFSLLLLLKRKHRRAPKGSRKRRRRSRKTNQLKDLN